VVVLARGVDQRPLAREVRGLPGITIVPASTNGEPASQTYETVHVRGTASVLRAAEAAGVHRIAYLSFLRARANCGSAYHESKWAAEDLVRASTCEWTVLKPGMMFGRGDHMLDHLSRALYTFPIFLGIGPRPVRPLAVEDVVEVLAAALVDGRLPHQTIGITGPTEIGFDDAARLVADVLGPDGRMSPGARSLLG
jgi:uncharacterized protein YbjT (DUF2867 family)